MRWNVLAPLVALLVALASPTLAQTSSGVAVAFELGDASPSPGSIQIRDLHGQTIVPQADLGSKEIADLGFSPDGKAILTGELDQFSTALLLFDSGAPHPLC